MKTKSVTLGVVVILWVVLFCPSLVAAFPVVESVNGSIWDVHPDRLLYLGTSGALTVLDRTTREETVIMDGQGQLPKYGFLTPKGVMLMEQSGSSLTSLIYDWRDGQLINLGQPNSTFSLKVNGNYAIWNSYAGGGVTPLILRDLITGTNVEVHSDCGNWYNDVTDDGTVVYWSSEGWPTPPLDYNIFRYRDGVTTQLTNDTNLMNVYPVTDGINVVYKKLTANLSNRTYEITMYGTSGEVTLTSARSLEPYPPSDYQVDNGWVAFTDLDSEGHLQVWALSPLGEKIKITDGESSSRIDALGPNGELTFENGGRLYLAMLDSTAIDIGSSSSKSFWQDEQWFLIDGGTLSVVPEPATLLLLSLSAVMLTKKRKPYTLLPERG